MNRQSNNLDDYQYSQPALHYQLRSLLNPCHSDEAKAERWTLITQLIAAGVPPDIHYGGIEVFSFCLAHMMPEYWDAFDDLPQVRAFHEETEATPGLPADNRASLFAPIAASSGASPVTTTPENHGSTGCTL